ncbi:PP2C family protein-serine/threonine phosphatase [Duganella callida]|uniref:Serine/threonine-protein phosphatase n=1 Tax=Duganella callida TaxID=2561932 RepID=A0A4Y9S4G1_9BURK|nr:protein phosphatase 2C domain-containing protein [Duganella callida]TFW14755.1 serine/threonine-protein phosphatase [Duganella callida]
MPLSASHLYHLPAAVALGLTDVGLVRTGNEDNFLIDADLGLAMVADGMGGHQSGEVASAGALTAVRDYLRAHGAELPREDSDDADATWSDPSMRAVGLIYNALDAANQHLYQLNLQRGSPDGGGMGTTLCGFWHPPGHAALVLFNVGDSRLYRRRDGRLEQLTRDQTLYQQALDAGMFEHLPARNLLAQAVGPSPAIMPEVRSLPVPPGTLLMLCSDGLYGAVPHGEMEQALAGTDASTLENACARLIALAKDYGGRDNITVLLTQYA